MFLYFMLFLMITTFGMMNVLMAVVVNSTLDVAQQSESKQREIAQRGLSGIHDSRRDGGGGHRYVRIGQIMKAITRLHTQCTDADRSDICIVFVRCRALQDLHTSAPLEMIVNLEIYGIYIGLCGYIFA